jgi:hypothetical protein
MNLLAKAKIASVGTTVRTAAADIDPQSMLKLEMNPANAVGIVLLLSLFIKVTDKKSSFQQLTKLKTKLAATPGSITGTKTLNNAPSREQPSIIAASSKASGTFSKKPRSMIVQNGMQIAM